MAMSASADVIEQEAIGGELGFQIIERVRDIFVQRLVDARLVAGFAPDQRVDDLLVEQGPDEEVAEPGIGIFLQPARSRPVLGVWREEGVPRIGLVQISADRAESLIEKSPSIRTGIRRSGLIR